MKYLQLRFEADCTDQEPSSIAACCSSPRSNRQNLQANRLLQVVSKWSAYKRKMHTLACFFRPPKCGSLLVEDSKDEKHQKTASNNSKQPTTTPRGYLAMYVGEERRRFLVKTELLNHPLFSILLEKAEEEFGFDHKGPLSIPCDIALFEHILWQLESNANNISWMQSLSSPLRKSRTPTSPDAKILVTTNDH